MRFNYVVSLGLLAFPAAMAGGQECFDCKNLVPWLKYQGKSAVAACYNPKFPRKQQPDCTSTSTCWATVTKKTTSTKTVFAVTQSTKTFTGTGPSSTETQTVDITARTTETSTETLTGTSVTTEHSPTITETSVETVATTTEITGTVTNTVTVTAGDPVNKRGYYAPLSPKSSSAACHCLQNHQPKKTKTVKTTRTTTKTLCAKTVTVTKTNTLAPVIKYTTIPGSTATKVESETVTTITDVVSATSFTTETSTTFEPTTTTEDVDATKTNSDVFTATATATCRVNANVDTCSSFITINGDYSLFRRACAEKIPGDAANSFPPNGPMQQFQTYPGTYPPCSAGLSCAVFAVTRSTPYSSFFISRLLDGSWRCTIQFGTSSGLPASSFVSDPTALEVFYWSN